MSTEEEILSICYKGVGGDETTQIKILEDALVGINWIRPPDEGGSVPPEFGALVARLAIESRRREQAEEEALSTKSVVGYYSVTMSLILWDPVFRVGLYGTIPWGPLYSLGFMAMALFIASVLQTKWILNKWWATVVISTFIVYIFFLSNLKASNSAVLDFFGALIIVLLSVCAIHLLTRIFAPQIFSVRREVGKTAYVQIGLTVFCTLAFAYCAGQFNYVFLTCENFETAGMKEPDNCERE